MDAAWERAYSFAVWDSSAARQIQGWREHQGLHPHVEWALTRFRWDGMTVVDVLYARDVTVGVGQDEISPGVAIEKRAKSLCGIDVDSVSAGQARACLDHGL